MASKGGSMKPLRILILTFLSACSLTASSPASAESAKDIMIKVDTVTRESYNSSAVKMKLSTCKYIVKQGSMHCTEKPRITVLESVRKDYGIDLKDTRSVSIVLEPTSDKGIGMLTYEYDAPGKDNDNWLYLSALGKVKRLISSSEDSDESGSFFGSEFSIEDMENRRIRDYTYKITGEETYDDRPVWIVESLPTPERERKTRYGKILSWVDKERYLVIKESLYDHHGKHFKQQTMKNIEKIDNVWVVRKITMNNLFTQRATIMEMVSVAFNLEVPDEFLTQRTLTDFAFRERNLVKFRSYLK